MKSPRPALPRILSPLLLCLVAVPAAAEAPAACTLTQVTSSASGDSFAGGLSANGRYLTLTSKADHTGGNPDQGRELFLYDRVTGELEQLTHHGSGDAFAHQSTISADGARVFYRTNVDPATDALLAAFGDALVALEVASGERVELARGFADAAVSADGSRAALVTRADPTGGNPDGNLEVFLLDLATGGYVQITDTIDPPCPPFPGSCPGQGSPRIDADGSHVAFLSDLDPTGTGDAGPWGGVYVYDVAAAELSRVVVHADPPLALSGDGATLAFPSLENLSGQNPGRWIELFVYQAAGDRFRQVPGNDFFLNRPEAFDRTGSRLAFSAVPQVGGGRDAFLYQPATGVLAPLMANPGVDDYPAAMTPDGAWISLSSKANVKGANPDGGFEVHLASCQAGDVAPPPPPGDWLTSPAVPGFRVKVRITAGGVEQPVAAEAVCIPETLCVSGAVPGRSEIFVRVIGPRPNGRLWPILVRFTTSTVEVWIEQLSSSEVLYYRLEGATPGSSDLSGLFDRDGFEP